jgi:F0F1-type ATP synthase membrane subunit c/vacuolar-type H+-ATPase subunit K
MTVVVGAAMLVSLVIYVVIAEIIKKQHAPFAGFAPMPDNEATLLRYVLLGVAAVVFFVIQLLNRLMLSSKSPVRRSQYGAQISPEGQQLMTAAVLTYGLCESVAIFGLVLFLIQGNSTDFYLFLMISFFYFAIYFPRFSTWEEWVQEKEKAARR